MTDKASRRLNHESVILIQEYSEGLIGGTELKLLLLEVFLYVPVINTGFVFILYVLSTIREVLKKNGKGNGRKSSRHNSRVYRIFER